MIICFNDKINTFSKNNFKNFNFTKNNVQNLMPSINDINCNCPKCNAKPNFSYHGSYFRNISFVTQNSTYDFSVSVTRVICNSCNSTHALLPSFIVPYKIFSLHSILFIVLELYHSSVLKLSNKLNLSFELIYSLFTLFISFFCYVDSLNKNNNTYKNFNLKYFQLHCFDICNNIFLINFFKFYQFPFLMTKFQNMKSPPVYINISI